MLGNGHHLRCEPHIESLTGIRLNIKDLDDAVKKVQVLCCGENLVSSPDHVICQKAARHNHLGKKITFCVTFVHYFGCWCWCVLDHQPWLV